MNKTEFVAKVAEKTGLTKKDAEAVVKAYHEVVTEALVARDKVQFVGFGTYETRKRAARTARNPQTGKKMTVASSVVPVLKFGKATKDVVNAGK